jgi:hypothetical protein
MLKKTKFSNTFSKQSYIMESDKDRYIQTLSFHEKQIKMYTAQILNNAKSWKKTKPILTKNLTLQQIIKQRLQLDFIKLCNWEHGGDLLNIKTKTVDIRARIVEVVKGTKLNTITNLKNKGTVKVGVDCVTHDRFICYKPL